MLIEFVFSVSLSLSVNPQFMLLNYNSVLSLLSIPGGLVEFLQLIVLNILSLMFRCITSIILL